MKKSLNGNWLFSELGKNNFKDAIVPGCNFLDLMNNGDIPDPFYSTNEKKVSWVSKCDWEYKKSFIITENELLADSIILNCKMLDTVCDVFVNNTLVSSCKNCFIGYAFEVKDRLVNGENEIRIVFYSPVKYVENKYKNCITPINSNGQNGIVHIRKPQCHFGWDWGPVLPLCGISGDIYLDFVNKAKINDLNVTQSHDNGVKINAAADITCYDNVSCEITVVDPDGKSISKEGDSAEFSIENPQLWWTYELSGKKEQPLYTVSAALKYNGEIVDVCEKKIGLRTIALNRERDEYGKNFQFILNGIPLFIKGSNYIPPDSFITRFNHERLNYFLDAAQFSNMNMLRIWGGGYYESDEFYNECDKRGILVWQDFQFACQAYPFFDTEFLNSVIDEVEYNVKRLCHHPSLAVWNGNNEIEDMHMAWAHMTKYVDWTEKFFYHILEPEIRKYDLSTPYTPGSPVGISHNKGVYSDNVGDTHLWGVWHGLQPMNYYRRRMTRFCSEFGFESLPDLKAIEKYAKPEDYSLSSEVFKAHQKCANGNDKMIYYIASRFDLPENFKDYVYLSQVTQLECIADATEHWRRNKGRCNGSMYWQFNDCWGVCSWSGIDYYGNYKALQYGAKHFNAPLCVSAEDTDKYIKIFAINDLMCKKNVKVEYEIFDFTSGTLELAQKQIELDALENKEVFFINVNNIKKAYNFKHAGVAVRLIEGETLLQQKVVLLDREKNLALPKSKLKTKIVIEDDKLNITVQADKFARLVKLESNKSSLAFSDNFFDLLPGQSKTVTIEKDNAMSLKELAESICVYSLCNIKPDKNKLKSKWLQTKVFLSPVNIANAIHHGKVAKDVKLDD